MNFWVKLEKISQFFSEINIFGCTVSTPFIKGEGADFSKNKTAIVALRHVILKDDKGIDRSVFWKHTNNIIDSLETQNGYLGHRVGRKVFGNEAWTMTVWEDKKH